jgi:hypothetical protein
MKDKVYDFVPFHSIPDARDEYDEIIASNVML